MVALDTLRARRDRAPGAALLAGRVGTGQGRPRGVHGARPGARARGRATSACRCSSTSSCTTSRTRWSARRATPPGSAAAMLTVHAVRRRGDAARGGRRARRTAERPPAVLAVTVLTSLDDARARRASGSREAPAGGCGRGPSWRGAPGATASSARRTRLPGCGRPRGGVSSCVTPGIRPAGAASRATSAASPPRAAAVEAGADVPRRRAADHRRDRPGGGRRSDPRRALPAVTGSVAARVAGAGRSRTRDRQNRAAL